MVKDGWSQASSSINQTSSNSVSNQGPQVQTILKNNPSEPTTNVNNNLSAAYGQSTNGTTPTGFSVWGVYESKEKFIDMHIC